MVGPGPVLVGATRLNVFVPYDPPVNPVIDAPLFAVTDTAELPPHTLSSAKVTESPDNVVQLSIDIGNHGRFEIVGAALTGSGNTSTSCVIVVTTPLLSVTE